MPKVLEDALGNLEYLMLALTFVGVMYLVYKQSGMHMNVSLAAANGAAAGVESRQGFNVDMNTMRFYGGKRTDPGFGKSGFAGSSNVAPEFWSTATEMDQLAGLAMDQDVHKEGMKNSYRVPRVAGMQNPLAGALLSR